MVMMNSEMVEMEKCFNLIRCSPSFLKLSSSMIVVIFGRDWGFQDGFGEREREGKSLEFRNWAVI